MARFFKLTTEISQIVRKANLTAAQLKIWLYFTEIDPFGDNYIELPELVEIQQECGYISQKTFYRAIAKFKELNLFDFQYNKAFIRNQQSKGTKVKNVQVEDKNVQPTIYTEIETLSDSNAHEEKKAIATLETATTKPTLSEIPKTKIDSLVKTESGNGENFPRRRR
jgi:hypothetical protein